MNGRKTLIDTSAWIETLRVDGDATIRKTVEEVVLEGNAVLCDFVRLELWNGARGASEQRMLRELESELECVPTSSDVWDLAVDIARKCRKEGGTVPSTDLIIFACAQSHKLALVHVDGHFDVLSELAER